MATLYSHLLPFELNFLLPFNRHLNITTFWTQLSEGRKENFLEIHENVALRLQFSEQQNNQIGQIEIETSQYNEYGDMEPIVIQLNSEFPYDLYKNRWSDNNRGTDPEEVYPWSMGYYLIRIVYNGEEFFSGIQVVPNNMSSNQVKRLQTYLESKVENICHDLIFSQKGFTEELNEIPDYMNYILFLFDYRLEIMSLIHKIQKNPYDEMKTAYQVSPKGGKQTAVSDRWNHTSKGMAYNGGFIPQPFSLIAKKNLNLNNRMNQWIKHIMLQWRQDIDRVSILVHDDLERLLQQEEQQRFLLVAAQTELDRIQSERDMLYVQQKQYKSAFLSAEARLKKIMQETEICRRRAKVLDSLSSMLSFVLVQPAFEDIARPIGKPVLKNQTYFRLDQLYENNRLIKKQEGDRRRYKPVLKRTWKLYEYFVLMQVIDVIRLKNFHFIGGFGQNELESYLEQGISEGSRFVLESERMVIHVWYDKLLPLTIEDAQRIGEEFYLPTDHRKPDIRLDFYNKLNDKNIQLTGCFVIEVKDSKLRNLYSRNFNRIRSQLSAYQTIYYCGPNTNGNLELKMAPIVKRVYCIHAGEGEGGNAIALRFPHSFLRLCPIMNEKNDISVFGLSELSDIVESWIQLSQTGIGI
jgi:hypothetical protein